MLFTGSCPRCRGAMQVELYDYEDPVRCVNCGHRPTLPPVTYIGNRDTTLGARAPDLARQIERDDAYQKAQAAYARRKARLRHMVASGIPTSVAAKELDVSARTAHRWLK
jgi:Zn ribbon nucleic-acid-binding protein